MKTENLVTRKFLAMRYTLYLCSYIRTLTSHSSTSRVPGTSDSEAIGTFSEITLTAIAPNTIQVNLVNTSTKQGSAEGNCIC